MEPCPGTYHYPQLAQRIEVDGKNKKKSWLITYCKQCNFNYDIEENHGRLKVDKPDDSGSYFRPWPHA